MLNTHVDELRYLVGGDNYKINKYVTIYNPYVYEIKDFGEDLYFHVLDMFTRKPYDIAVELFDKNIDYQEITDYDLFFESIVFVPVELTCILFGKLDFTRFQRSVNIETGMKCLVNKDDSNIVIDEAIYRKMVTYLRYMHYISEKVEFDVGNAMAKRFLIDRMRRKQKKLQKDYALGKIRKQSRISDMIRYCVNNSNFKYDYSSVLKLKLNLLYDSYYFIIHGNNRDHIMSGVYSGTVDASKMKDKSVLNIIPDLHS